MLIQAFVEQIQLLVPSKCSTRAAILYVTINYGKDDHKFIKSHVYKQNTYAYS